MCNKGQIDSKITVPGLGVIRLATRLELAPVFQLRISLRTLSVRYPY